MTSDQKKPPGIFFIIKWVGASFIVGIFLYIVARLLFQFGVIDDFDFQVWIIWGGLGMLIITQSIILRLENIPSKFWFIIGLGILGIGAILTLGNLWVPNLDLYMIAVFIIFPVIQGGYFVIHLRRKGLWVSGLIIAIVIEICALIWLSTPPLMMTQSTFEDFLYYLYSFMWIMILFNLITGIFMVLSEPIQRSY